MLFAVEGGGFFSSSATGYSKALTLLLLGRRKKDKPKRVLPWNQYHLVDQEPNIDPQLASSKKRLLRRCASFVCFSCTADGLDASSSSKKDTAQFETGLEGPVNLMDENHSTILVGNNLKKTALRSSLKKSSRSQTKRMRVQWTDAYGSDLAEIREYEPSEMDDLDDDIGSGGGKHCSCVIM